MPQVANAAAAWHNFYELLGTASATMIGLLFVAATVGSGVFSSDRRAPLRVFLSASVVHFSSILAVCLIILAPLTNHVVFGLLIVGGGLVGLVYYAVTWRDMMRDSLISRMDLEDRIWYACLPVVGYILETASGSAFALRYEIAWPALAASTGLLLLVAIHNAWDITVWSMTRRRN
jgi:hypothetical protein